MDKELLRRQKISQTLKGRMPKNLNLLHSLKRTEEWKRKIGLKSKGRKHTEEVKIKCGLVNKGKKLTEEHKKKISKNNARYWNGRKRESMTGKKNWNYGKYGSQHTRYVENKKTSLRKAVRQSKRYYQYKLDILRRDGFSCKMCGNKNIYLELDHYPISFSELFEKYKIFSIEQALACEELWDINNGRILCQPCHETTDSFPKQLVGKRKPILYKKLEVNKVTK